jgi:enoyl-CoA hydratase
VTDGHQADMSGPVPMEAAGDTVTLWLDRPERGNALGPALVEALDAGIDAALARGARLIVLRGRNFCTGLDLADLDAVSEGDLALRIIRIELLLQKISGLPVTTMAVASGRVIGAGADLFAACDRRLALTGSSFSFPGPAFGLVLGTGRLAGLVGNTAARLLLLDGAPIDTGVALALGLATAQLGEEELPEAVGAAGRACHAIELSPAYVDVAVTRWQAFTGQQAVRESDGLLFQTAEAA